VLAHYCSAVRAPKPPSNHAILVFGSGTLQSQNRYRMAVSLSEYEGMSAAWDSHLRGAVDLFVGRLVANARPIVGTTRGVADAA